MKKRNTPPAINERLTALRSLMVINRSRSWGWARTPMPTPITMVETKVHHTGAPNLGIDVHPRCPPFLRLSGTRLAMEVRASWPLITPPTTE